MRILDQVAMLENERNIDAMVLPVLDSTLPPAPD